MVSSDIRTRPLRRLTQAELDRFLERAADILRGNVDHSEFRGYVFALLFYKRISDIYVEEVQALTEQLGDEELARDPRMHNFVVPENCLWSDPADPAKGVARTTAAELGAKLNEAMRAIELANEPKFDGILRTIDFQDRSRLPQAKLVSLVNHFSSQPLGRHDVSEDLFGDAYEYLIRDFASKAGKSSGEFYTPREVAFLLSEMVEPQPGHEVCDWASGSGSLLLQCRRYVKEHGGDPNQLFLHSQESNLTTYNISRINLILHGVKSWQPRHGDSLREPLHLDERNQIKQFDRIVMNPPFSLKDWGYADFVEESTGFSDSYNRMTFGTPPKDNGDYAWLQHVVKSLKSDGQAIIVMSQGVLFRGQPKQTEEEDGQNQKADAEYLIREGFINNDLIECVVVLPSKLFYGNNVPGCLVLLNKAKAADRKNKILMIWASRHFQQSNPQNLLRPSDLMRILVPWRSFGDLPTAQRLVGEHEEALMTKLEAERTQRLQEIKEAYDPVLEPLPDLKQEQKDLEAADPKAWAENPEETHPYFGGLAPLLEEISQLEETIKGLDRGEKKEHQDQLKQLKANYRNQLKEIRQEIKLSLKRVKQAVKELEKLATEQQKEIDDVNNHFDREVALIREEAKDLLRICNDPEEAKRYFAVVDYPELEENEFNLNLPRYIDTFERQEIIDISKAIAKVKEAEGEKIKVLSNVYSLLENLDLEGDEPC